MANRQTPHFDPETLLAKIGAGKTIREYRDKEAVFSQGNAADAVFYIHKGKVKLTVVSKRGKEAVVAVLKPGSFFGEGCLAGQRLRISSATALEQPAIVRVEKERMVRLLHEEPAFAEAFIAYMLSRNIRIEEDLVNQLFNSAEKRLARVLLLMARYGKEGKTETVVPKIRQETLAEMIGTTRSKVSHFMNKFKDLGFIEYNGSAGGLQVHNSLLNVVLHD
ncbi:MAG: Crp/Fnr family transcriptional regulator [Terriglobia bacterium]